MQARSPRLKLDFQRPQPSPLEDLWRACQRAEQYFADAWAAGTFSEQEARQARARIGELCLQLRLGLHMSARQGAKAQRKIQGKD